MKGKDVILGLLKKQDRTGYEINECFNNRLSHFFDGGYGMIYPTLKKLEQDQYITKKTIVQDGKPNKNIYKISSQGEKEFTAYLKSELASDAIKSDFLMRIYFGEYLANDEVIKLIENALEEKVIALNQLQSDFEKWNETWTEYQQLSCEYGIEQYKANIRILKKYLKIYTAKSSGVEE